MLAINNHKILPAFDFAEIVTELEFPFIKSKPLSPVKSGSYLHNFNLKKDVLNKQLIFTGGKTHNTVLHRELNSKPLVISFYSSEWKQHGLDHLKHLNNLQGEIKALGANLLIITPNKANKLIDDLIWDNSLVLDFYFDDENLIAKKLGIYADAYPAWNKYPGIDVNVPLLATYVIDNNHQVVFDHIDSDLQLLAPADELLKSAHAAALFGISKKSA